MAPEMASGPPADLLVVVAHPDDETFGCGSLLAWASARGARTAVCCATRGEAGEVAAGCGIRSDELPLVRERELRAAADLLGVGRVDLLRFEDSGMAGEPPAGSLAAAALDEVVAALTDVLQDVRPKVVVVLDASDGHRDHLTIRQATESAVERLASPPMRLYHWCLLRSLMRRWVEHVRLEQPDSEHLDVDVAGLGTPDEEITTILDTSAYEDLRRQAIRLHASQTSPYEVMPPELRHAFLASERLRRVRPPWQGGSMEDDIFPTDRSSPPAMA